jgi:hypothetical protein
VARLAGIDSTAVAGCACRIAAVIAPVGFGVSAGGAVVGGGDASSFGRGGAGFDSAEGVVVEDVTYIIDVLCAPLAAPVIKAGTQRQPPPKIPKNTTKLRLPSQ